MTRDRAKRILDQLKDGDADYSARVIRDALRASGDLVDDPPPPRAEHPTGRDRGWLPGVRYARALQ